MSPKKAGRTGEAARKAVAEGRIVVHGVGRVMAVPDIAHATLGIEASGPAADEALAAIADVTYRVIEAARGAGAATVETRAVVVAPRSGPGGAFSAYVATDTVSVVSPMVRAGAVVDAAVAAGATHVHGPVFAHTDEQRLYRQALALAVEDAHARAEIVATAANAALGPVLEIVENGGRETGPLVRRLGTAAETPVLASEDAISASVDATFILRSG